MRCEECGKEISMVVCSGCGADIASLGQYCYICGAKLAAATVKEADEKDPSDYSDRILCSDGTCIGIVNEEGICKVCGKPYVSEAS